MSQAPLSAIAERRSGSGEDTEDDDEEAGGWKIAKMKEKVTDAVEEGVIKSGYLWKKGERRKVPSASKRRMRIDHQVTDLEKTMVCATPSPSGILQELGGVPVTPSSRVVRRPFVHSGYS